MGELFEVSMGGKVPQPTHHLHFLEVLDGQPPRGRRTSSWRPNYTGDVPWSFYVKDWVSPAVSSGAYLVQVKDWLLVRNSSLMPCSSDPSSVPELS